MVSGTGEWQEQSGGGGWGREKGRDLQRVASGLLPKIKPLKKKKEAGGEWWEKEGEKRRWERREGSKQPLHTNSPAGNVSNTRLVQRE